MFKCTNKSPVKKYEILFFNELLFFLRENVIFIEDNISVFLHVFLSNKYKNYKIDESVLVISDDFIIGHKINQNLEY